MSVIVSLSLATICFTYAGEVECHPMLYGKETKPGTYQIARRYVMTPGYGGDVLQFNESQTAIDAIHRTYQGNPAQRRNQRLASPNPEVRMITNGCINIAPEVYDRLVDCCSSDTLTIER